VFWGLIRTPADKRDKAMIDKAAVECGKLWARLDQKLAGKLYVAGQYFTIGDIPVGCFVHRWYALPIDRPDLKNVKAWYERLKTRPAYVKYVMAPLS
jgi:glutathione S-transferase